MQTKSMPGKQTAAVLLIALALILLFAGGLWVYVGHAQAETGIVETAEAKLPEASAVAITWEKYDNYPSDVHEGDLVTSYQGHGLTAAEKERLETFRTAYASGTRPEKKAPSLPAETGFAILPLNPGDYDGITEYYFLPNQRLTDEQLLQLIAYGEEKGTPFTADTLSVKNCMRGGAVETNRFRSAGEDARRDILHRRILEEGLRPKAQSAGEISLPLGSVADIPMNEDANYGLDVFHFNPVREMTDEEIITELFLGTDPDRYLNPLTDDSLNPVKDVDRARTILGDVLNMPPSARKDVFEYAKDEATGEKRLTITFYTPKINGREGMYYIRLNLDDWQCMTLFSNVTDDSLYSYGQDGTLQYGPADDASPVTVDLGDERCLASAREAVKKLTGLEAVKAEPMLETNIGNTYDKGMLVSVQAKDTKVYQVSVRYEDAVVTGIDYQPDWKTVGDWKKTWQH